MLRRLCPPLVARAARGLAPLLPLAALTSCAAPPVESEPLATFVVVGSVDENTCGPMAVGIPDPWTRTVELARTDVGLFLWKEPTGVVSNGSRTATGEYRFRGTSRSQLVDAAQGYPGCQVRLDDELRFTLAGGPDGDGGIPDAGVDAGAGDGNGYTLKGTQTTVISVVAGSDCTPVLNSSGLGGNFLALPCTFSYDLTGEEPSD
jgi:hypothetical protein